MLLYLYLLQLSIFVYTLETPIIGILSQETYIVKHLFDEPYDSFIVASYVKYLESAGARVLPVWIGQDYEYYRRVVNYTNGILFPGGGTYFNETNGYGEAAKELYNLAVQENDKGVYYPVWGTCLGMEVLAYAALNKDIRVECSLRNVAIPLHFKEGYEDSKIYSKASRNIIEALKEKNVTYNFHGYCLTRDCLKDNGLLDSWNILSTNEDVNKLEFISSMESKKYPIYGVQFHPEKNCFEFKRNVQIPHNPEAVQVGQYFANFFVNECRKNNHTFPSIDLEKKSLIYNYSPTYTGIQDKSSYEQIYKFTKSEFQKNQLS